MTEEIRIWIFIKLRNQRETWKRKKIWKVNSNSEYWADFNFCDSEQLIYQFGIYVNNSTIFCAINQTQLESQISPSEVCLGLRVFLVSNRTWMRKLDFHRHISQISLPSRAIKKRNEMTARFELKWSRNQEIYECYHFSRPESRQSREGKD